MFHADGTANGPAARCLSTDRDAEFFRKPTFPFEVNAISLSQVRIDCLTGTRLGSMYSLLYSVIVSLALTEAR